MGDAKKLELEWPDLFKPITGLKPGAYDLTVKRETIPIIFVPGIMGSRLKNNKGEKIWDPDAPVFMLRKYGLVWCTPAKKKKFALGDTYDEGFAEPYEDDQEHNEDHFKDFAGADKRRWGGVAWSSYGKVLSRLATQTWTPAVKAAFDLPVYAFGYNWTASNSSSGKKLKAFIDQLKKELPHCSQVLLVTHSMGGLVSRSALLEHGADSSVLGVVHGVQPATGSGAAYWRMKAGFERTDIKSRVAAWVLGTNGEEVTAMLGNMPGGLQLLPSQHYTTNSGDPKWLQFEDFDGKVTAARPLTGDPYAEIYKNKTDYWRAVNPAFLSPGKKGAGLRSTDEDWGLYCAFVDLAKAFHDKVKLEPNVPTEPFHGVGTKHMTPDRVVYRVGDHGWKQVAGEVVKQSLRTVLATAWAGPWGAGAYLASQAVTHSDWWESRGGFKARITKGDVTLEATLQAAEGGGDGTVPESSGRGLKVKSQEFKEIGHEPAYTYDSGEQQVLGFTARTLEKFMLDKIKKKVGG